jgi:hypothetical protein
LIARHFNKVASFGRPETLRPPFFVPGDTMSDEQRDIDPIEQNARTSVNPETNVPDCRENNLGDARTQGRARADKNHLHSTHHGVLCREPLETLVRLGENKRHLRQIEKNFRAELKPSGTIANAIFDRMFCCYLRCLLAAKLEARALAAVDSPQASGRRRVARISSEELPTLIFSDETQHHLQNLSSGLCGQIALVQKYDSHFSREFFRSLGLLLVLKNSGEVGLAKCIGKALGAHKDSLEG